MRILRMSEALAARGHSVHAVTYHLGEDTEGLPFEVIRTANVPTYRKVAPGPSWQKLVVVDPLLMFKLRGVLKRRPIDVIHAHHYEGLLVALLASRGTKTPVIFDAHTLLDAELHYYGMGLVKSVKNRIARWFDNTFPRRAHHVITVTDSMRDRLIEDYHLPPKQVTAITNGVELEHFDLGDPIDPTTKTTKTLIFTGNLAEYQGVAYMLEAFAVLRQRRQDVRLLIASGDPLAPYETQIKRLGIGDAIDHTPAGFKDLPRLMHDADVALNPRTQMDGIPQKLLNYMAAAKPVVSFAGSSKVLEHQKTGLIVPDEDVTAMAEAVDQLLNNPAQLQAMGLAARQYVATNLTWARAAEMIEAVYRAELERDGTAVSGQALAASR